MMRDEIHLRFSINLAKKDDDTKDDKKTTPPTTRTTTKMSFLSHPKKSGVLFFLRCSYVVRVGKSVLCPCVL